MNRIRIAGIIAALALAVASCSSDGEETSDSEVTSTASSTPSTPSTTDGSEMPPTTTVDAPSTTVDAPAESDPESPTTVPSTTEQPATTSSSEPAATTAPSTTEAATPAAEIEAVIEAQEQQWKECLSALPECDTVAVGQGLGGDVGVETAFTAELWNGNGYTASRVDELEYRVDEVMIGEDETTARATVCVTDPVQINEADGTPVNASYQTSIQEYGFILQDGDWVWVERTPIGDFAEGEENSLCT